MTGLRNAQSGAMTLVRRTSVVKEGRCAFLGERRQIVRDERRDQRTAPRRQGGEVRQFAQRDGHRA